MTTKRSGAGQGRKRPAPPRPEIEALLGHSVEVRTIGQGVHRGELAAVGTKWLALQRRTGRLALLELSSVTAVLDEEPSPALKAALEGK